MGVEVNCGHSPRPSSPSPEPLFPDSPEPKSSKFTFGDDAEAACQGPWGKLAGGSSNGKDRKPDVMVTNEKDNPPIRSGGLGSTGAGLQKAIHLLTDEAFKGFQQTKEKLKKTTAKVDVPNKGPLIAKHPSSPQLNIDKPLTRSVPTDFAAKEVKVRECRTPSPQRRSVKSTPLRRCHSNINLRCRSPSSTRSRPNSPASSERSYRGSSPASSFDNIYIEVVRKRIQKTRKARLYLLQQCGPHSFVVGGDSPEHKFKTIIGPQTCSCGRGPHCIHLLFVMLRMFQVSENDPRLWTRQLKNFEVESLFAKYEERRQSRLKIATLAATNVASKIDVLTQTIESLVLENCSVNTSSSDSLASAISQPDEGENCSICHVEMVDGESLVSCDSCCRNKFHHHCMSVWSSACHVRGEKVRCPLCRWLWDQQEENIPSRCGFGLLAAAQSTLVHSLGQHGRSPSPRPMSLPSRLSRRSQSPHSYGNRSSSQQPVSHHPSLPQPASRRSSSPQSGTYRSPSRHPIGRRLPSPQPPSLYSPLSHSVGRRSSSPLVAGSLPSQGASASFATTTSIHNRSDSKLCASDELDHRQSVRPSTFTTRLEPSLRNYESITTCPATSCRSHLALVNFSIVAPSSQKSAGVLRQAGSFIHLPRCHSVIPKKHLKSAATWTEIYGSNLVSCLFSRDSRNREIALKRLSQEMSDELSYRHSCMVAGVADNSDNGIGEGFIRCCCEILSLTAADQRYPVYLSCLQCLRNLLAYVSIRCESHLLALQELVQPIVVTILKRCSDGTKQAGMLSMSTLIELCKGQSGELAVGQHTSYMGYYGVGGIGFMLRCILAPMPEEEPDSWKWILGRLNVLEKLMSTFSEDFRLVLVPPSLRLSRMADDGDVDLAATPIPSRLDRVMSTLEFAADALQVQRKDVCKQARNVFMMAAQFADRFPAVLDRIERLAASDSKLDQLMKAWIRGGLEEFLIIFPNSASSGMTMTKSSHCAPDKQRTPFEVSSKSIEADRRFASQELNYLNNSNNYNHHQSQHPRNEDYSFVKLGSAHPHLPSCGGISPATKIMDRGMILEAFSASRKRSTGPAHALISPLKAIGNRFPLPPSPIRQDSRHQSRPCRGLDSRSPSAAGRRPTFLPLNGSFRDVLEWERQPEKPLPFLPGTNSSSGNNHGSNNHSRPDRSRHRVAAERTSNLVASSSLSAPPSPSRTSVTLTSPTRDGRSPKRKMSGSCFSTCRPARLNARNHEIKSPDLSSARKPRPLNRVFPKKVGGLFGSILPSMYTREGVAATFCRKDGEPLPRLPCIPPPTSVDTAELLDNSVNKQKHGVKLEEMVAETKIVPRFVQSELPIIQGLMQYDEEKELVIHVEPDDVENNKDQKKQTSCPYYETVHWKRGSILGKGAFSNCYQARDIRSGTLMAVKQVTFNPCSPEDLEKVTADIKDEIALMSRLDHPHVVRMLGATRQQGHFNMFVEWMPGGSVTSLLEKYGAFTEPVIINYIQQVLSGLAYLHDRKIVHRDLKGANLLVDSTGQHLRIADFGAAAQLASQNTVVGEFRGQVFGTIAFMAPEVLRGENYGRSCDIWSVGCIIYEMATGKPPWDADISSNYFALLYKIACAQEPPFFPSHLSRAIRDLALRCLEISPINRLLAKDLLKHPVFRI